MPFKVLIILFILFIFFSGGYHTSLINLIGLGDSLTGFIERANVQSDSDRISTGRWEETEYYLSNKLNFSEYLFGRGMGGYFTGGPIVEISNIIHIGIFHVFLKGGILLVLTLYIPIIIAVFRYWNTPSYHISLILIYFLIVNSITTSWSWSFNLFFYWYGISFYYFQKLPIRSLSVLKDSTMTFNADNKVNAC